FGERSAAQVPAFALSIQPHHLSNLAAINLRSSKAELFLKSLLKNNKVPVFEEDQRKDDPIVARAHQAVESFVPKKCLFSPARDIGRRPARDGVAVVKGGGSVAQIARGKKSAALQRLRGAANQH